MGRLGSECVNLCICVSLLPAAFWTVTLNESKYSIILEGLRKRRMMLWKTLSGGGGEGGGDYTRILVRPSLRSLSRRRKTDGRLAFQSDRAFLLTFNCWHNTQPGTPLHTAHKATHTHTHINTKVCNEAECDASNAVNSEVKAGVVKWQHSRQLLLLPRCDYSINHWMKALPLILPLILLLEDVDGVTEPIHRHTHAVCTHTHTYTYVLTLWLATFDIWELLAV